MVVGGGWWLVVVGGWWLVLVVGGWCWWLVVVVAPVLNLFVLRGTSLRDFDLSRRHSCHRRHLSGARRCGFTLLELIVALVVMGVISALVAPSLGAPRERGGELGQVLQAVRGAAIARAQTLSLTVGDDGAWTLTPLAPDDSMVVLRGQLDAPPSAGFRLQLTAVGACLSSSLLPVEFGAWDAARCAPTRGIPARGIPTGRSPTHSIPTHNIPTRGMPQPS